MQLVAGSRVSTSTDEGFALALSDSGDVYSWGKGYKGRLGHSSTENVRSPKMVDALGGKDVKTVLVFCLGHIILKDHFHKVSVIFSIMQNPPIPLWSAYKNTCTKFLCC